MPVSLNCQRCGHGWEYTGERPYTSCPRCRTQVKTGFTTEFVPPDRNRDGSGLEAEPEPEPKSKPEPEPEPQPEPKSPEIPPSEDGTEEAECPACGASLLHTVSEVKEFRADNGTARCVECGTAVKVENDRVVIE